jgi:hypothetical protein
MPVGADSVDIHRRLLDFDRNTSGLYALRSRHRDFQYIIVIAGVYVFSADPFRQAERPLKAAGIQERELGTLLLSDRPLSFDNDLVPYDEHLDILRQKPRKRNLKAQLTVF